LGFVIGTNYNSASSKIVAPYPLNLLGTLRLRICSFELSTTNLDYTLITLPIEIGNFGLIQYTNISNIKSKLINPSIDSFDILIIDDNNNPINFNNINWTMSLLLTIVRKKQNISNLKFYDIVRPQIEQIQNEDTQNEQIQNEDIQNEDIQNEQVNPEDENNYIDENIYNQIYNNHGNLY
jgi:hypothetical protein